LYRLVAIIASSPTAQATSPPEDSKDQTGRAATFWFVHSSVVGCTVWCGVGQPVAIVLLDNVLMIETAISCPIVFLFTRVIGVWGANQAVYGSASSAHQPPRPTICTQQGRNSELPRVPVLASFTRHRLLLLHRIPPATKRWLPRRRLRGPNRRPGRRALGANAALYRRVAPGCTRGYP